MTHTKLLFLATSVLLGACASSEATPPREDPARIGQSAAALSRIPRGSTCAQLGLGNQQLTLAAPVSGSYAIDGQNSVSLTYYDDTNTIFYFNNATLPITGVMASIGNETLVWEMPEGQTSYGSLHGPPSDGFLVPPEEVTFCFDYQLRVQPSPYASRAQRPSWTITKSGRSDHIVLAEGQEEPVDYSVTVNPGAMSAAGQFFGGPVYVQNASPNTVTVDEVRTRAGLLDAVVTCPTAAPFTMAPFTTIQCSFRADVPDTSDRNIVGSATVSHGLRVTTQEVVASFSSHTTSTTTIDRCVRVQDEAAPFNDHFLGTACTDQGAVTFNFATEIGPFACGAFAVTNTASYVGLDSGATGDASWTVSGETACNPGCTLGAGYWRNHSQASPRRYNPIWSQIGPQGEDTAFLASGDSYLEALTRPIQGNGYWNLSRPYIAARLNQLNGARFDAATQTAFNNATTLLNGYTPAQVEGNNQLRKTFQKVAADLRDFNSGRTGPGRCTSKPDLAAD